MRNKKYSVSFNSIKYSTWQAGWGIDAVLPKAVTRRNGSTTINTSRCIMCCFTAVANFRAMHVPSVWLCGFDSLYIVGLLKKSLITGGKRAEQTFPRHLLVFGRAEVSQSHVVSCVRVQPGVHQEVLGHRGRQEGPLAAASDEPERWLALRDSPRVREQCYGSLFQVLRQGDWAGWEVSFWLRWAPVHRSLLLVCRPCTAAMLFKDVKGSKWTHRIHYYNF